MDVWGNQQTTLSISLPSPETIEIKTKMLDYIKIATWLLIIKLYNYEIKKYVSGHLSVSVG